MSDTSEHSLTWTEDIHLILGNLLDNIKKLAIVHKQNYLLLRYYLFCIRIPIICISAVNSIIAVGMTSYLNQSITSTTNCLLSLITGILGSLELFLGLQKNQDNEYNTYQSLNLLGIKISSTLKLNTSNRSTEGLVFLNECIAEWNTIFENSLINKMEIEDNLFKMDNRVVNPLTPRKLLGNDIIATL